MNSAMSNTNPWPRSSHTHRRAAPGAAVPRVAALRAAMLAAALLAAGCTAPPSVAPLLRVADRAMAQETDHLTTDLARHVEHLRQTRQSLEQAYRLDLEAAPQLSPAWVLEATAVYVAAREALVRHEADLREAFARRADNLAAARQAQDRALRLLERQDDLIRQTVGVDLWRLGVTKEHQPCSNP